MFVNLRADTYTIEVTMPSFSTLKRSGVAGQPRRARRRSARSCSRSAATTEVVDVKAEAPMIQASSGERSFTIETDAVTNLPIAGRAFTSLAALAPGVTGTSRIGDRSSTGGGDTNVQMDGVSTMDTGSNRAIIDLNVESIAEVKVLVSSYQAEFGRSSGLQITAVTKSGTNRFRGSVYDVERNSDWNANSKTNILNGDPKTVLRQREWGYSIGGPVGKPGGANKLFFFYTQEFEPRTGGNDVVRYRLPTALERQGDFSQSTDNLGNPYPYVKNPAVAGTCSATSQAACFADGGVLGRIPAVAAVSDRAEHPEDVSACRTSTNVPAGQPYNFEITRPSESILSTSRRCASTTRPRRPSASSFKYSGFSQREQVQQGSIPGLERHAHGQPERVADRDDGQLHAVADVVPRRHVRPQPGLPGRLLRRRRRRRTAVLQRVPRRRQRQPQQHRSRRAAVHLPGGQHDRPALLRLRPAQPQRLADVGRHASAAAAELLMGQPGQQRRPARTTRRRTSASRARTSPRAWTSRSA